jgi:hypothetical protein
MANEQVEKWAHYARYERRFLGQDRVANLNCTFEVARTFPYSRSVSGWRLRIQISKHSSPLADLSKVQSFDGFRGGFLSVWTRSSPVTGTSPSPISQLAVEQVRASD